MAQKMLKSLETMQTIFRMQSRQSMNRSRRLSKDVETIAEMIAAEMTVEGTTRADNAKVVVIEVTTTAAKGTRVKTKRNIFCISTCS